MKNKVINLFNKRNYVENKGVKYSSLLEQFITPLAKNFEDVEFYDDIFEFAIYAWNMGKYEIGDASGRK
jgi:hypothetical protein